MAYVATAAADKVVRIFDSNTFELIRELKGHQRKVTGVEWSPDGNYIATCSSPTVRIWDAKTGAVLHSLKSHTDYISCVKWSNSGNKIASASEDKLVKLWDAATGEELATLEGHEDAVTGVTWNNEGTKVASTDMAGFLKVWDTNGTCLKTEKGHTGAIYCVTFNPDGSDIATCGDISIHIRDTETLQDMKVLEFSHHGSITWASYHPEGARLASSSKDCTVHVWDTATWQQLSVIECKIGQVERVKYGPLGKRIACAGPDGVALFDAETGEKNGSLPHPQGLSSISGVTWSPIDFKLEEPTPAPAEEEAPADAE